MPIAIVWFKLTPDLQCLRRLKTIDTYRKKKYFVVESCFISVQDRYHRLKIEIRTIQSRNASNFFQIKSIVEGGKVCPFQMKTDQLL